MGINHHFPKWFDFLQPFSRTYIKINFVRQFNDVILYWYLKQALGVSSKNVLTVGKTALIFQISEVLTLLSSIK